MLFWFENLAWQDDAPSIPSKSNTKEISSKQGTGLDGMNRDLLIKEHPELAMQAGLVKKTKVNEGKKRKQYFHEGNSFHFI
jgi:hypothetical protein